MGNLAEIEKVKVVILAGYHDFGRCPLASRLLTALWPVADRPVLEHLLTHLADEGIKQAVVCSGRNGSVLAGSIRVDDRIEVSFLDEELPVGTAGCIRDAVNNKDGALILVFPACIVNPPKVDALLKAHKEGRADLTMMFDPSKGSERMDRVSGIYVFDPAVIKYIPKAGYADVKEGLVPELLRNGRKIHAALLAEQAGNFRDSREYLYSVSNMLINNPKFYCDPAAYRCTGSLDVWVARNAKIDPSARIFGPVVVMDGASVSGGAVVLGPTVLGKKVSIGEDSVVINSILWEGSKVGSNSQVQHCVLNYQAFVPDNTVAEDESILFKLKGIRKNTASRNRKIAKIPVERIWKPLHSRFSDINGKLPDWIRMHKKDIKKFVMPAIVFVVFLWSYKSTFRDLWIIWQRSDEYSSGLLVPFLTVYVLWARRSDIIKCPVKPCIWGLFAFVFAQVVRFLGLFLMYSSAERLSIALSIAALVLLLFGWRIFIKVATILLFMCLMLPLPNQVQAMIAQPLQRWATSSAVFCLETVGYEVLQEGNIIHIGHSSVAVAEACNGLRMVTAFFVTSGLVVLLVNRKWWEKLIVLISSLPIALLCNTIRLAVTAVFFTILEGEQWEKIFHDFGGYAMMPLALAAIVLELWLLTKLTSLPEKQEAIIITRNSS